MSYESLIDIQEANLLSVSSTFSILSCNNVRSLNQNSSLFLRQLADDISSPQVIDICETGNVSDEAAIIDQ